MSNDLTFGVKITADGKQLVGEVNASSAALDKLGASAQRAQVGATQLGASQDSMAQRLNLSAAAQQKVSEAVARSEEVTRKYKLAVEASRAAHESAAEKIYVVNDAHLKAAGGADKAAFATQGARRELMIIGREVVSGDFSKIPGSMMVLASRANLSMSSLIGLGGAFTATAAAAVVLGVAFVKGREEMNAMNNALAVTSNYAGLTRGGMESLASSMAASGQLTIGTSKDIVTALVASGRIGAEAIGTVARLTGDFARATGADISRIAPEMVKLFSDPLKGAEELNKSMHFLTAADMEHIATLEQLGRTQEAQLFLAQKVSDHLPKEAENIGIAAKAWRGLKDAISGTADALMGIGKTSTVEDGIAKKGAQLADQWARMGHANISTQNEFDALLAQSAAQQEKSSASAAASKKITDENELAALAKQNSELWKKYEINLKIARLTGTTPPTAPQMDEVQHDAAYQLQKKNDVKVKVKGGGSKDANEAYRADIASQEAFQRESADLFKRAGEYQKSALDAGTISQADYIGVMTVLREADLRGQAESYRKEEAAALAHKNKADAIRYGGEAAKAQTQIDALPAQKQLELDVLARKQRDAAAGITRPLEAGYRKDDEARQRAAEYDLMSASARQYAQVRDKINDSERAAAEALKARFPETERQSAAYKTAVDEIKNAHDEASKSAAEWVAQQDKLNASWEHGASVALRNYRDEVANVSKQSEQLFTKAMKGMEDAVTQFAMTGKLDIRSFANTVIEEFYRINVARPLAAQAGGWLKDAAGAIGGFFGLGGGSSAGVQTTAAASTGNMAGFYTPSFAVGTDYVPRDMFARIHEGERIVPKAFNPTIGNGSGGTVIHLTNAPVISIDSRTDRAEVSALVANAVHQGNAALVDKLQRAGALS